MFGNKNGSLSNLSRGRRKFSTSSGLAKPLRRSKRATHGGTAGACPPWRVTDELAAYKLAQLPFPGVFGVFYESDRPTKNALEKK